MRKKILFIGGSLNQTTMLQAIAAQLPDHDCYFTPYYCDGFLRTLQKYGWLDFTPLGGSHREMTFEYLQSIGAQIDESGQRHSYDLVLTSSDLIVQKNIRDKKVVLVQEGMTDPENAMYRLVRRLGLPRYLASTSTTGLSLAYDKFCVASEGYRDFFIRKGIPADRLVVTGLPNFDNLDRYRDNDFPHRHYVLVATSDARETYKIENRRRFIRHALRIADGRPLIFKLHPNENHARARREIARQAPHALVADSGDIKPMIANCDVLVTQYSTVVYVGIILGKEVHSYFDLDELKRLVPVQNGGSSGRAIAHVCRRLIETPKPIWKGYTPAKKFPRVPQSLLKFSRRWAS
jgi:hypothetical protein